MTINEKIDRYCSYFDEELNRINSLQSRLHSKTLLMVILDTLARVRNPIIDSNRERFLRLITECADWADGERVSLYQLSLVPSLSGPLHHKAIQSVANWPFMRSQHLEADPFISELLHLADNDIQKKAIMEAKHINLLYTYRNHLIHEFREPGHASETDHKKHAPYYLCCDMNQQEKVDKNTWELVYPLGFFIKLVRSSLITVRKHLQDNTLDPYSFYDFGTMWKRKI